MRLPIHIKEKALELRKKGLSLKEISDRLRISKSTASLWLAEIPLSRKAQQRLKKRGILGQYKSILIKRKKREKFFMNLQKIVRSEIDAIPKKEGIYRLICSILFWCEGNKNNTVHIRFTNSDPAMIRCFLYLLRTGFEINESKFRALIHLHKYHNESKQVEFWSRLTKIPKSQFNKSFIKPNTQKRIRQDYPGCIAISYYDANLAKKLWMYYKEVQETFA